jgi:hypothetical protein
VTPRSFRHGLWATELFLNQAEGRELASPQRVRIHSGPPITLRNLERTICKTEFLGSHLLLFELSLPVVSQQFRPPTAILAASGGLRHGLGVSAAAFTGPARGQCSRSLAELAESLRCPCQASPLFNRSGSAGPGTFALARSFESE